MVLKQVQPTTQDAVPLGPYDPVDPVCLVSVAERGAVCSLWQSPAGESQNRLGFWSKTILSLHIISLLLTHSFCTFGLLLGLSRDEILYHGPPSYCVIRAAHHKLVFSHPPSHEVECGQEMSFIKWKGYV